MSRKKSSSPLIVLLILACAAVMAAGIFLSRNMDSSQENTAEESSLITAEDGIAYADYGQFMRNAFFDFRVNSSRISQSYEDLNAEEGEKFVIVNITVANPYNYPLPMADIDFSVYYGSGDDDWNVPVTYYDSGAYREGMLKSEYTVKAGKQTEGDLVFSVPSEAEQFIFTYIEYYENGEYGDVYAVMLE